MFWSCFFSPFFVSDKADQQQLKKYGTFAAEKLSGTD